MSRRGFIGSADAPEIFKGNPLSLLRLWELKTGIKEEDSIDSDAIRHGNRLEKEALEFFSEKMDEVFWPCRIFHEEHLWMRASLDGMDFSQKKAVEVKCPYSSSLLEDSRKGIFNRDHLIQMQHQMLVADLPMIYYLIYKSKDDFAIYEIKRDEEIIKELLEKEQDFWEKVINKECPVHEREDLEWCELESRYIDLYNQEKALQKEKEVLSSQLKMLSGGASVIGKKIILTRYFNKGSIRYSDVPELKNVDLDKYRGPEIEVWRTTLRKM